MEIIVIIIFDIEIKSKRTYQKEDHIEQQVEVEVVPAVCVCVCVAVETVHVYETFHARNTATYRQPIYRIALIFRGSKFSRIAVFERFQFRKIHKIKDPRNICGITSLTFQGVMYTACYT